MTSNLVRKLVPRTIRNWLRSPIKSASYILDRVAFMGGARPKVSPVKDWELSCHPAAKHYFEIFKSDPSQSDELRTFASHCSPDMRLLDIGAHYGLFALACCHYSGPSAKVLCVEASPKAASILHGNLRLNGLDGQVNVVNCAIGNADGKLEMLSTGPLGGDYFVSPSESRSDTIQVPQLTLESLLIQTKFQPTHIKIDIESFEYETISSARACLAKYRPILFLEIHGTMLHNRGKDPADIVQMLKEAGYAIWSAEGDRLDEAGLKALKYDCRVIAKFT